MTPVQWQDAQVHRWDKAPMAGVYQDLGELAGSVEIGVGRWRPDPGSQTTPAHVEGGEEEISYILAGSGWSWQDGATYTVRAGDVLVHRIDEEPHTLVAGDDGLDVLAFGERASRGATTWLPRAGVLRVQDTWVETPGGPHPYEREGEAGRVELGEEQPRPERIVAVESLPVTERRHGATDVRWRDAGRAAGSVRTGLRLVEIAPGAESVPPHMHTAEEELFIVLGGNGVLRLDDTGHPVREGSVVARPAGTRVAHSFLAGDAGLKLLAYGQRDPRDIAWYPRSNKLYVRGIGVMLRVSEPLGYWDGEPE
jgi:uncharacterized cupin superfamily protein